MKSIAVKNDFLSATSAIAMVTAFLLAAGGIKLMLSYETRRRGILMIVAALVLATNVMIWTV